VSGDFSPSGCENTGPFTVEAARRQTATVCGRWDFSKAAPPVRLGGPTNRREPGHSGPGTVSISASTLTAVIDDIRASLDAQGIIKLIIVSGHGGNYVLRNIAQQANTAGPRVLLFPTGDDWATARRAAGLTSTGHEDMHCGEAETSILLHTSRTTSGSTGRMPATRPTTGPTCCCSV
jgi:creatinine amidohydrolase/Fe(II)-dependent formamide hydrolase-like protein